MEMASNPVPRATAEPNAVDLIGGLILPNFKVR